MNRGITLVASWWLMALLHTHAQSFDQLEQARTSLPSRQTIDTSSAVSPLNIASPTSSSVMTSASTDMGNLSGFQDIPRNGFLLPGEATMADVFPKQQPLDNPPFAANLFIGGYESERTDSLNDSYLVTSGDKLSVWLWGAYNFADVVTVDSQGNIFLPNIGPIKISDVPSNNVSDIVTSRVKQVYTTGVNVYVNLLTATPVAVFVAGPVIRPGQYAGQSSDSVLYFLKRAGGVDFRRGSFRSIDIVRDGNVFATVDLYKFIQRGTLPTLSFQDGDTILVNPLSSTVTVSEGARNSFTFEIVGPEESGEEILSLAKPDNLVTHVSIAGVRGGEQIAYYLPIEEFKQFKVQQGDSLRFISDVNMRVHHVNIAGSYLGASQLVVNRGTRLKEVLDYIEVDPKISDLAHMFILRESVAEKQKEIIDQALQRLERSVFTAPVSSTGEGGIRVQEAQLITDYIARAKQVEPVGKVVVSDGVSLANVVLEPGDTIYIPEKTDLVQVGGEVMLPQALVFNQDANIEDYLAWSGGFTQRADDSRIMVVKRSGVVTFTTTHAKAKNLDGRLRLEPGDYILVLPEIETKTLQAVKDITQILFQIALAANVVTN